MTLTMEQAGRGSEAGVGIRALNTMLIWIWRLGFGALLNLSPRRLMVLTTWGRVSGRKRRVPVAFAPGDGSVYCVSVAGDSADWYRNLRADPHVEVWLPDGRWRGFARRVDNREERLRQLRVVLQSQPRVADFDASDVSDAELDARTAHLRVVRITFDTRTPGNGRSRAWLWLLAGLGMAAWWRGSANS